jgi:hypothetical protein
MGGLVLVAVVAVGAIAAVTASVRCTDAARELVRLAARGEPDRGREIAARLAPSGAVVELTTTGDEAIARVETAPFALLPVRIGASAVAVLEPGAMPNTGGQDTPSADAEAGP